MSKYNKDLVCSKITNRHIGSKIIFLDEVDSTNKYALSIIDQKPCVSGTVVVADSQYAGKGRLDRSWYSPKGVNLYLSVILIPDIKTEEVNILTFVSSVATVNTLLEYGLSPEIKWPNDVQVNRKKISGVLTEINMEGNKPGHVVVGIGINLNVDIDSLSEGDVDNLATSVYIEQGKKVNRNEFLIKLLNNLDECYECYIKHGKEFIYNLWESKWNGKGKTVSVNTEDDQFTGRCVGLDKDGFMLVHNQNDETVRIVSGDVVYI